MEYAVAAVLLLICIILILKYHMLVQGIRSVCGQLAEITQDLEQNRILRLKYPDRELERLQLMMNRALYAIREQKVSYAARERAFQQQIENISHDLRTPLTSMNGYLRLLDRSGLSSEDQENLKVVLRKTRVLQELITQFYDYSRLTAQDYAVVPERLDIARALREFLLDAYPELSDRRLAVELSLPEHPVWVMGNMEALNRIFQNLIQNACRYAVSSLQVSMVLQKDTVRILFSNDVSGMEEGIRKRLFERFFTGDGARSHSSTGLGLAIAKELSEKMNGSMEAREEQEGWLTIELKLPAAG